MVQVGGKRHPSNHKTIVARTGRKNKKSGGVSGISVEDVQVGRVVGVWGNFGGESGICGGKDNLPHDPFQRSFPNRAGMNLPWNRDDSAIKMLATGRNSTAGSITRV